MSDHLDELEPRDLSELLDRVTTWVERPGLADVALRDARRRRRRGTAAAVVATAAVLAVVVVLTVTVGGAVDADRTPPVATGTSASPAPRPTVAGPVEVDDVQPAWDPDDVADLPWDDSLGLPRDLTFGGPAERGPTRAVAVSDGVLRILGPAGWYVGAEVPDGVGDDPTVAVAPDGTRVAIVGRDTLAVSSDDGWTPLPLPAAFSGSGDFYVDLDFVGDDRLLLGESDRFWEVDLESGEATRLPYDGIDEVVPAGTAVVADRYSDSEPNVLERWRDGATEVLGDIRALESTQRPASDGVSLATVRADGATVGERDATDTDGLLVLDLDGLGVRGLLPVPSRNAYYSDSANLTPIGFTGADTVLAEVRPSGSPRTTWLITWDVGSGELRRVASFPTDQPPFALAIDALGRS